MNDTQAKPKWYANALDWVLVALLLVEGLLFLSDQYDWFAFNQRKGWTVLIVVAVVGGVLLLTSLWAMASWTLARWTRGKPFQFGLRPAMLVMVVVGIVCGWFASAWRDAQRQREVLREVNAWTATLVASSDTPAPITTPAWLKELFGDDFFTDATEVWLGNSDLSDAIVSRGPFFKFRRVSLDRLLLLPKLEKVVLINMQSDSEEVEALKTRGIEVQSVTTW